MAGRLRPRFLLNPDGLRRIAGVILVALWSAAVAVAGLPLLVALGCVIILLGVVVLTLDDDDGPTTVTVVICWLVMVIPLGWTYPEPQYPTFFLALLAVPIAITARLTRGYGPWLSIAPALAVAGVLAEAAAYWRPSLGVTPAWAGACAVAGLQWLRSRRTYAPEAYASGWAQERDEAADRRAAGEWRKSGERAASRSATATATAADGTSAPVSDPAGAGDPGRPDRSDRPGRRGGAGTIDGRTGERVAARADVGASRTGDRKRDATGDRTRDGNGDRTGERYPPAFGAGGGRQRTGVPGGTRPGTARGRGPGRPAAGTGSGHRPVRPARAGGGRGTGTPGARGATSAAGTGAVAGPAGSAKGTGGGSLDSGARVAPYVSRPGQLSVEDALAELDAMIGLEPVKEQVRSIAASLEAARLRERAGMHADTPLRHFVFAGPPGTGKTTVARILAKIFYSFGLLPTAQVVEAQRSDLVGDHLGATALKTDHLVDGALGGVLLVDEAYSLVDAGAGQPDRFGNEAVQTLLKRAEDDRAELVIVLAGYGPQMEEFLSSNPGLSSRFGTRVRFPGYGPEELVRIAEHLAERRGDRIDSAAVPALRHGFDEVDRRGVVDELGNGRFVRSLTEAAARARDVRVVGPTAPGAASAPPESGAEAEPASPPSPEDLVTIRASDIERAFAETTERYRGGTEAPTLDEALAALDRLVGLDAVKYQVHAIAAQLRVARLRQEQGLPAQQPMRHFVFTGPPGTGKTTVARVLGRVFAALGLLSRADVVEAQRADLVGEHLGATAVKTNRLVDSALGGVLFIDEAYALHNPGYAGGDAFGAEAVQTLLKRAEDDRARLVVVLAGYPADMNRFLGTNPGLSSRFSMRVAFPSYGPDELLRLAELLAEETGDRWTPEALDGLAGLFQRICGRGLIDELGNGRFVRSLYERSCASRDVRIAELGTTATMEELTTVTRADARTAWNQLMPPSMRRSRRRQSQRRR